MRRRRGQGTRRSGERGSATGMAPIGWLFADMMIGLFVIALATQAAPRGAGETPRPLAARTTTGAPAGAVPSTARMEQVARIVRVSVDAKGLVRGRRAPERALRRALAEQVAPLAAEGRRAALVLVWGYAPGVDAGMALADAAEDQLDAASPVFAEAVTREFWHRGKDGQVAFEIYLFGTSP
jgi:hypothetical protein